MGGTLQLSSPQAFNTFLGLQPSSLPLSNLAPALWYTQDVKGCSPKQVDYPGMVHARVGRAGRAGRAGGCVEDWKALNLV